MNWRHLDEAERQLVAISARKKAPVSLEWVLSGDKESDLLCVFVKHTNPSIRGRCWLVRTGKLDTPPEERQAIETLAILRYNLQEIL